MLDFEELYSAGQPRVLMMWLHGLGADGFDLQPAAEMLGVAGIRHVFPHAPVRPVTVNGGMGMRAWFDVSAADLRWREDSAGMQASAREVVELMNFLNKECTMPVILAGFSQGAVVSLVCAAMGVPNLFGVAAMSGYVPQCLGQSLAALRSVPILMAHGEQDSVIPFAMAKASRDLLEENGVEVAWHAYPMSHTISQQELMDIADWMKNLETSGKRS